MGGGFAGWSARQHSDLTPPSDLVLGRIVLALLAVDGVISAVVGALLLPSYVGSIPFPVSALASGALNAALVWAAMHWTDSMRIAALPLWTWLATVVLMTFGGPGEDLIFAGRGLMAYSSLIFIVVGALPAVAMLRRRHRR
ncbi:hypothetical protein A5733_01825 [Mycobacterium sp. NS-7484]|uniref:hypothetical protein n=1 Tax=unclassified Mycobacterium TaxID=2642494 RepID=UPI0007FFCD9E|nr:hypothetical protein A5699_25595 [Mycobacterium sp. E802]OMB94966.1 hypothetical protein A5733_01825 [Mycobacterium sp. NS-7484]